MGNYESNPNQRMIKTHKEPTNDECKENYYAKINLNALRNAMANLTPKTFELWIYLSKNVSVYECFLSKADFLSWANVKRTSYYNAFKELVDNGYLVEREESPNHYDFYELPKEKEVIITVHKEFSF